MRWTVRIAGVLAASEDFVWTGIRLIAIKAQFVAAVTGDCVRWLLA